MHNYKEYTGTQLQRKHRAHYYKKQLHNCKKYTGTQLPKTATQLQKKYTSTQLKNKYTGTQLQKIHRFTITKKYIGTQLRKKIQTEGREGRAGHTSTQKQIQIS